MKILRKIQIRRIVVLLLLTTLLTLSVGRVKHVEAVATTAAIVGEVLLGLGVTYIAYQTLTGANVYVPDYDAQGMSDYLKDVGRSFSKTSSGSKWYDKLYSYLYNVGLVDGENLFNVTLTRDDLIDLYNTNKDIAQLQDFSSYTIEHDISQPSTNFDYSVQFVGYPTDTVAISGSYGTTYHTLSYVYENYVVIDPTGMRFLFDNFVGTSDGVTVGTPFRAWDNTIEFRNVLKTNGYYILQYYNGTNWVNWSGRLDIRSRVYDFNDNFVGYLYPYSYGARAQWRLDNTNNSPNVIGEFVYPLALDAPIYVEATGETIEVIPRENTEVVKSPQYPQNDDGNGNKYPIVPYVQLPNGSSPWGFNLHDALVDLINRGGQIITASWIGQLINAFKDSLSGDEYNYYSYYDDSVNNVIYYEYYNNSVNDYNYPVYNINISEQEDIIPVDLNTISQYTTNEYLTHVKENAVSFGSVIGDWFVFWNNSDPVMTYTILGCAIMLLLGAFIGKWGHS